VKVAVDTNVLLRVVLHDDAAQARAAEAVLKSASVVAIPLPALCELVWVLGRSYRFRLDDIIRVIETFSSAPNVVLDGPAVEAGLEMLRIGGDFADGVIAYEGAWLGGETFVSFDRIAVAAVSKRGQKAKLLK